MIHDSIDIRTEGSEACVHLDTYILNITGIFRTQARPLIIVVPGGGYAHTSDREAEPIALTLNAMGYHAAVLRYSCAPARFPVQLVELAKSLRFLREQAASWKIRPDKIGVLGFSAGAHLAACLGCYYDTLWLREAVESKTSSMTSKAISLVSGTAQAAPAPDSYSLRPDCEILCYPVITAGEYAHRGSFDNLLGPERCEDRAWLDRMSIERQVKTDFPKTFLWHTMDDHSVPVQNSLLMAQALAAAGVSCEYHLFEHGTHGLGLADWRTHSGVGDEVSEGAAIWPELLRTWLDRWAVED